MVKKHITHIIKLKAGWKTTTKKRGKSNNRDKQTTTTITTTKKLSIHKIRQQHTIVAAMEF